MTPPLSDPIVKAPRKILALEAYYGGSHKAFLDSWIKHSSHDWTVYGLPAYKWKWRMRHSAISFAQQLSQDHTKYDLIFCSDMLNLPAFRGLTTARLSTVPAVIYFHENQLTYPDARHEARDLHFAYTNFASAVAADAVWFNSQFHRSSWLEALKEFLRRMPDHQHVELIEQIRTKSQVHPPGVDVPHKTRLQFERPPHILWVARWEEDKNPAEFFQALFRLDDAGFDFRLSVLGESFQSEPPIFEQARTRLAARIDHWGFVDSREDYVACLRTADIVVSSAQHEFFGIAMVEAIAAGAIPILPRRLAYPEILAPLSESLRQDLLYCGSVEELTAAISTVAVRLEEIEWRSTCLNELASVAERFRMDRLAPSMDGELITIKSSSAARR